MKPYYEDDAVTLYHGDIGELLADESLPGVHLTVTSPPYADLISYGAISSIGQMGENAGERTRHLTTCQMSPLDEPWQPQGLGKPWHAAQFAKTATMPYRDSSG